MLPDFNRGVNPYAVGIDYPISELGFARRVVSEYGDDLGWFPSIISSGGTWYQRQGRTWAWIREEEVDAIVCRVVSEYFDAVLAAAPEVNATFYARRYKGESDGMIKGIIRRMKADPWVCLKLRLDPARERVV